MLKTEQHKGSGDECRERQQEWNLTGCFSQEGWVVVVVVGGGIFLLSVSAVGLFYWPHVVRMSDPSPQLHTGRVSVCPCVCMCVCVCSDCDVR